MKNQIHSELGIGTRKLRGDARIDHWPLEERKQILQWLADGDPLRDVAAKIHHHFGKRVHFATVGKFYARERKRDLAVDFHDVSDFYQTMTSHAARHPINFSEAMQLALGMEFMRAYSANRLSPNDLLRYCQAIIKQRHNELRSARLGLEEKRFESLRQQFELPPEMATPPQPPGDDNRVG